MKAWTPACISRWIPVATMAAALVCAQAQYPATSSHPAPAATPGSQPINQLIQQLDAAEVRLRQSQKEIDDLQAQIRSMRQLLAEAQPSVVGAASASLNVAPEFSTSVSASAQPSLGERVDVLEAEIKQQEQAKVGSVSRYPVRLTGLLLFNSFLERGGVDNINDPSVAYTATSTGATARRVAANFSQTVLGVQATGPHVFGALSSGEINLDFSGSPPYSSYGTSGGTVRLRTGALRLNWNRTSVEAGYVSPMISPLSPTSYATVAEPGMSWAGNLWIWSPQFSYLHRFGDVTQQHFSIEAGLLDPPSAGTNDPDAYRVPSPGERSAQPAYESRVALGRGDGDEETSYQLGVGGYYSRQTYPGRNGDSWATTVDWKIPAGRHFQWSGEAYRGRSLAGLGGTVYKDVISGTNPANGAATFRLLNGAGGWTQAKVRILQTLETNASFGLDTGFARDFRSLLGVTATQTARNQMAVWNIIYTPRSYIVISPEYRFIRTSPISSASSTAHIFTLSLGYKF